MITERHVMPCVQVIVGSGYPITEENRVQFHLLYSGKLHSNGDIKEKHNLRKSFHPQLRRLWLTNSNLRKQAEDAGRRDNAPNLSDEDAIMKGLAAMGHNWIRNGFNFIPLVTERVVLRCSLDILFLRAEEKNYILQGGDIDGRLKTLFDSLRMIRDAQELPTDHAIPGEGEEPFFVLLEDDSLISEVRVNANQLLLLPGTKAVEKDDVYLQIAVQLNPTVVGWDTHIV
jgi:hypothetical protein